MSTINVDPFFSVIIPFKDASSTLKQCLDSLLKIKFENFECILVNNNSSDNSVEIIKSFQNLNPDFPLKLVDETKPGAAAARNTGIRVAKGIWLAFTDSDCLVDQNWLRDFQKAIEIHPDCNAFAGCIRGASSKSIVSHFLGLFTLPPTKFERLHTAYHLIDGGFPTANLTIKKSTFLEIGGFNENTRTYGEDHELCSRIYNSKNSIYSLTCAIVLHIHRGTLNGLIKQSYAIGFSHGFCLKHLINGAIILLFSKLKISKFNTKRHIWIDFGQIDKKIILIALSSFIHIYLIVLVPLYYLFVTYKIYKRSITFNLRVSIFKSLLMTALLILKSSVMTWGRIRSAIKYKVLCI